MAGRWQVDDGGTFLPLRQDGGLLQGLVLGTPSFCHSVYSDEIITVIVDKYHGKIIALMTIALGLTLSYQTQLLWKLLLCFRLGLGVQNLIYS